MSAEQQAPYFTKALTQLLDTDESSDVRKPVTLPHTGTNRHLHSHTEPCLLHCCFPMTTLSFSVSVCLSPSVSVSAFHHCVGGGKLQACLRLLDVINVLAPHLQSPEQLEQLKKVLTYALRDSTNDRVQKRGYRALLGVCDASNPAMRRFFLDNLAYVKVPVVKGRQVEGEVKREVERGRERSRESSREVESSRR